MNYIYEKNNICYFDKYFQYLDSIRNEIPENLVELVCDHSRYELTNPRSFHDAWLKEISIIESGCNSGLSIHIKLLGQMHDRYFDLSYLSVSSYLFSGNHLKTNSNCHGDLLLHEFSFEDNTIRHEINFSSNSDLKISCKEIIFEERFINHNPVE